MLPVHDADLVETRPLAETRPPGRLLVASVSAIFLIPWLHLRHNIAKNYFKFRNINS